MLVIWSCKNGSYYYLVTGKFLSLHCMHLVVSWSLGVIRVSIKYRWVQCIAYSCVRVPNGAILLYAKWAIQWIYKCQMGRFDGFISAEWDDSSFMPIGAIQWIFKCQMGRFLCYAKWGDSYFMPNGVIHYYMLNEANKIVISIGVISESWFICISCVCINIESWVMCLFLPYILEWWIF